MSAFTKPFREVYTRWNQAVQDDKITDSLVCDLLQEFNVLLQHDENLEKEAQPKGNQLSDFLGLRFNLLNVAEQWKELAKQMNQKADGHSV